MLLNISPLKLPQLPWQIIQKDYIVNYKSLMRYIVKKGNKHSLECLFHKGLIFWCKNIQPNFYESTLTNAFINTTPHVTVKIKRKGSKNIYIAKKLSENHKKYLAAKWMLTNAALKKKRKLYEGIIEELFESSLKTSICVKKRNDLHKLVAETLPDPKKKKKFKT